VAEPKVRTIPPKEDKVDTSSAEDPTAQALVARSGSKAPDDNLTDDDPDLLNFAAAGSEIICQMSSWLQTCWPDSGKPDCPVFMIPDVGLAFLVLSHENVEGGLGASLWLAPLIFLPLAVVQTFWLNHPWWPFFFYDDLLAIGRLGLR
jgi:hypothetical protein